LAIICTFVSVIYYFAFVGNTVNKTVDNEIYKQWALLILMLIPVLIITYILVIIIFHIIETILRSREEGFEVASENIMVIDELDQMVDLRASRNAFSTFSLSFIAGLISQLFNADITIMFNIFYLGIALTGVALEISKYYYYRRGF